MMDSFDEFNELRKIRRFKPVIPNNPYKALLTTYRSRLQKKINALPRINNVRQEVEQCLDLLGAIFEFRKEPDTEEFLSKDPQFETQRVHVEQLWNEFKKNDPNEMYELIKQMFEDIDKALGGDFT